MKQTIYEYDFHNAFCAHDRFENFTDEARSALYNWLEELEQDTGQEIELDVIALCCDFNQDHWKDIADNYAIDLSEYADDEDKQRAVLSYLEDNTQVIASFEDGSILYQVF